jgi:hypothetical protein
MLDPKIGIEFLPVSVATDEGGFARKFEYRTVASVSGDGEVVILTNKNEKSKGTDDGFYLSSAAKPDADDLGVSSDFANKLKEQAEAEAEKPSKLEAVNLYTEAGINYLRCCDLTKTESCFKSAAELSVKSLGIDYEKIPPNRLLVAAECHLNMAKMMLLTWEMSTPGISDVKKEGVFSAYLNKADFFARQMLEIGPKTGLATLQQIEAAGNVRQIIKATLTARAAATLTARAASTV